MSEGHQEGALPAPPGVALDLDLSHNPLRATYTAALVSMLVFPTLVVPLRVYTKIVVMKSFKFADVFCVVGFVCAAFGVVYIVSILTTC
jgi:H+/Cl- antiporter ClcA